MFARHIREAGRAAEIDCQRRVNEIRDDCERRLKVRSERITELEEMCGGFERDAGEVAK